LAKNLKINIKNTQLAEALKLGKIKKPAPAKKKAAEEVVAPEKVEVKKTAPSEDTSPAPVAAQPAPTKKEATPPPPAPAESPKPPVSAEPAAPPAPKPALPQQPARPAADAAPSPRSSSYPPREQGSYPPRQQGGYPPREQGSYPPRQQGGYPPREQGSYPPRQQGGYPPREQGSYPPRQQGGYPPREQGSYPPRQQGGYPPREQGSYPPRQQGGYPPREQGSYPPRQQGGYPPRTGGNYPPRQGGQHTGGYAAGAAPHFRRPGFTPPPGARPPSPYPPRREPYGSPRPGGPSQPGGYRPPHGRPLPPSREPPRGDDQRERKEEPKKLPPKEFREHKPTPKKVEERSFDARDRYGLRADQEEQTWRKRRPQHKMRPIQQEEIIRPKSLSVRIPITLKDLASEMKLKASQLIAKLFMKGVVLTLNDFLDDETTIQLLGQDFDCEISIDRTEEARLRITDKTIKQEIQETSPDSLILRPPVVAFMGHVDHGKTSLIDAIRKSDLAAGEAGAITQHIGAFKCHTAVGDLTILDTPGHEAFSAMRSRGADVTDIVVLVVAGDEGIRTQTVEAIEQAQAAQVPILVALSKSDKPNFNADNVYRQLSEKNLLPETWGGQTITVNCSSVTGEGIKELLEMLALQAEVLELRSNPTSRARGTVIESEMHKGLGAVATVLVQNGTLKLGDALVFTQQFARVKTMHDEHGKELMEAGPSTPVKITGLSDLPEAGSEFIVVKSEKEAMEIAEKRSEGQRHALLHLAKRGAESFLAEKASGIKKKILNLILRADVQGSVEALKTSLLKITSNKIELNIISAGVGEISESDVELASASKATIVGFHTKVESHAESLIKATKVTVKLHDIIYHAVDDIRKVMLSMLDKIAQESDVGEAEVKAIFKSSHLGVIAGCLVTDGSIKRSNHVRLQRDGKVIWKGPIHSLKKVKEDVREMAKGHECGIVLQNNNDIKVGDLLQAFEITYLEQEL
jgi:translation initiation factor IF-2